MLKTFGKLNITQDPVKDFIEYLTFFCNFTGQLIRKLFVYETVCIKIFVELKRF